MRRLEDKIALVTGGGAGIGRAIAETFAREGAHVVLADRDGEAAREVADAIVKSNGSAQAETVDVTDTEQVKALMGRLAERFGRLDVLVNNAGVGERSDFRHLDDAAWDKVWKTNVDGTVRCAREAFELLKASGNASIINLSSVMATKHTRQMSVYSATKGAVSALSRSLAVEYAPYGIRVNALCPGYVETALIGRYMALRTSAWQVGFLAGPALGSIVLARSSTALWYGAAAMCALAALGFLILERNVTPELAVAPGPERVRRKAFRVRWRTTMPVDDPLSPGAEPAPHQAPSEASHAGEGRRHTA